MLDVSKVTPILDVSKVTPILDVSKVTPHPSFKVDIFHTATMIQFISMVRFRLHHQLHNRNNNSSSINNSSGPTTMTS